MGVRLPDAERGLSMARVGDEGLLPLSLLLPHRIGRNVKKQI